MAKQGKQAIYPVTCTTSNVVNQCLHLDMKNMVILNYVRKIDPVFFRAPR